MHLWTVSSDIWQFRPILRTLQWYKAFFPKRGDTWVQAYPGSREIHLGTLLVKGERKERDLGTGKTQSYKWFKGKKSIDIGITLMAKRGTDIPSHYTAGGQGPVRPVGWAQTETLTQWADKTRRASRDPHLAGRDPHPLGYQPGHQGEWASVKETSHTQGMQPVHQGCMIITKSNTVLTA